MNRRIVLGAAGVSLVLLVAWFFALWQPKGSELETEQARVETAEDEASALRVEIAKLQAAEADGPRLLATRDRLRSAVPDEPALAQFILDVNDAAIASGIEFVSIAPAEPAPPSSPGLPPEIGLSVAIEGGYFQTLDFVERLTDLKRVVVLDGVNVSPMGTESGPPQLTVSLKGRMFTSQLPAVVGAAPAEEAPTPDATTTTTTPTPSTTVVSS